MFNQQHNGIHNLSKWPVQHLYSKSKLQDVYKFISKSQELSISKEESTLLRAIAVLSTGTILIHCYFFMNRYIILLRCICKNRDQVTKVPNNISWKRLARIKKNIQHISTQRFLQYNIMKLVPCSRCPTFLFTVFGLSNIANTTLQSGIRGIFNNEEKRQRICKIHTGYQSI